MSTHNICFCREISKILYGYPLLSVAMVLSRNLALKEPITTVEDKISISFNFLSKQDLTFQVNCLPSRQYT